jgi:3-oxoacyl-[acyl-carrier protein] reductase
MYTIDFTGKVVLVVGGGTGIGAAIGRGFADAGATLAVSYRGSMMGAEAVAEFARAAASLYRRTAGTSRISRR